jgi:trk system potassium uptake protein TrkA
MVFVGAGRMALATARELLTQNHEVIIIEKDKDRINALSDQIDCGFLSGDGSTPALLKEAGAEQTDFLFCLTNSDQINIIASLVGRSLGYSKIITKIEDAELTHICKELGLENTIIPTMTISRHLTDLAEGRDIQELSSMIRGDARFYSFIIGKDEEREVSDLNFSRPVRVVCYYRDDELRIAEETSRLKKGDEVVIITHGSNIEALKEQWSADRYKPGKSESAEERGDSHGT